MKTINVRSKHSFEISDPIKGQITKIASVDGEIQSVVVTGNTGVVTAKRGSGRVNYVYDLERGTLLRVCSV